MIEQPNNENKKINTTRVVATKRPTPTSTTTTRRTTKSSALSPTPTSMTRRTTQTNPASRTTTRKSAPQVLSTNNLEQQPIRKPTQSQDSERLKQLIERSYNKEQPKPKQDKKNKISIVVYSIVLGICLIISIFNIATAIKLSTSKDEMPTIFGSTPIVVKGNLNGDIKDNDLIFIKKVNTDSLEVGDIICFNNKGVALTHRIVEIKIVNNEKLFITVADDKTTKFEVLANEIYGKFDGRWKGFGNFLDFMQGTGGIMIFIVLPIALYTSFEIILFVKRKKKSHK